MCALNTLVRPTPDAHCTCMLSARSLPQAARASLPYGSTLILLGPVFLVTSPLVRLSVSLRLLPSHPPNPTHTVLAFPMSPRLSMSPFCLASTIVPLNPLLSFGLVKLPQTLCFGLPSVLCVHSAPCRVCVAVDMGLIVSIRYPEFVQRAWAKGPKTAPEDWHREQDACASCGEDMNAVVVCSMVKAGQMGWPTRVNACTRHICRSSHLESDSTCWSYESARSLSSREPHAEFDMLHNAHRALQVDRLPRHARSRTDGSARS